MVLVALPVVAALGIVIGIQALGIGAIWVASKMPWNRGSK